MRIAVVDIGTNSTRLLVADVAAGGEIDELERRSEVTRLGEGVDASGSLAEEAMERVHRVLDAFDAIVDALGARRRVAVLTSAVRDAANGAEFVRAVAERHGLDARVIAGEEEARLTFLGATSERPAVDAAPTVVIDIGGGSTEFIVGRGHDVAFHVSTQVGVVRQTERHLRSDPPGHEELVALAAEARGIIEAEVPERWREEVRRGIAVAGTATSMGAIELGLEPYDPERVHGHRLGLGACERILAELAALDLDGRREVPGLHPDRAPTIVAGAVVLVEAMRCFALEEVEVSEHDILRGVALGAAAGP